MYQVEHFFIVCEHVFTHALKRGFGIPLMLQRCSLGIFLFCFVPGTLCRVQEIMQDSFFLIELCLLFFAFFSHCAPECEDCLYITSLLGGQVVFSRGHEEHITFPE